MEWNKNIFTYSLDWIKRNFVILLIFILPHIIFYFSFFNKYYDSIFIILLVVFIFIILYKYFVRSGGAKTTTKNNNDKTTLIEHPFDDNRFMAITSIVAIVGLILTVYSKALIDNNSNISELINNSLTDESSFTISTNEITNKDWIVCIDKSGSVNKKISQLPKKITKGYLYRLFSDLEIQIDNHNEFYTFVNDGLKNKSLSFLNKVKAIELVQKPKLYTDSTSIVLFGNNSIIEQKVNNKEGRRELVKDIVASNENNNETNFILLFEKIKKLCKIPTSKFRSKRKKVIIYSDFIHDVSYKTDNERKIKKKELLNLIKEVSSKDMGLYFVFLDYNKREFNKTNKNQIDVKEMFDSLRIDYSAKSILSKKIIYYDDYKSEKKIHFYYRNSHFDSSHCLIKFNPSSKGLTHRIKIEDDNNIGDLYYCLNDKIKRSVAILDTVMSDDIFRLHYNGSYTKLFNNKLLIRQPAKEESFSIDIVFTNVMPRFMAWVLKFLLFLLLSFECIYICNMNIKIIIFIKKNVKNLLEI